MVVQSPVPVGVSQNMTLDLYIYLIACGFLAGDEANRPLHITEKTR